MKLKRNLRHNEPHSSSLQYRQLEERRLLAADFSDLNIIEFNNGFDTETLAVADKLVFAAVNDLNQGNELVLLDSATGARQVVEINPGTQGTSIRLQGSEGDLVFFTAWNPDYGNELHWLDVTEANPQVNYLDAEPGTDGLLRVQHLHVDGNNVFFSGETATFGEEFYSFDLNLGASSLVFFDIFPDPTFSSNPKDSDPENFVVAGNKVFFHARGENSNGLFWVDLGDSNPTLNTYDVEPYKPSLDFVKMTAVFDRVYLQAEDAEFGVEPRWIDATEADPALNTFDLRSGTSGSNGGSYFHAGDHVYFSATTPLTGSDLFRIDVTATSPTVESLDIYDGDRSSWPSGLTIVGDTLFFEANADTGNDVHWIDLTAPTFTLGGVNLSSEVNPAASRFTAVGDKLFFTARIADLDREIHWLDLTDLSLPPEILDLYVGEDSSEIEELTVSGNRLYFHAETETDGRKVRWLDASNPSAVNTIDSIEGEEYSIQRSVETSLIGDRLFFAVGDPQYGLQLRWLDTQATTPAINTETFAAGHAGLAEHSEAIESNGKIYFFGGPSNVSNDLYWIDTNEDVRIPRRIDLTDSFGLGPSFIKLVNDKLYFTNLVSGDGTRLQWIDTLEAEPVVHTVGPDFTPGTFFAANSVTPHWAAVYGDRMFVTGYSDESLKVHWIDTNADPSLAHVVEVDGQDWDYSALLPEYQSEDYLFFFARDLYGYEPRWLDPYSANPTVQTLDIYQGLQPFDIGLSDPLLIEENLFFVALDEQVGNELHWVDTRSTPPVVKTLDLLPGIESSNPLYQDFVKVGDEVCVSATIVDERSDIHCFDPSQANPAVTSYATLAGAENLVAVGSKIYFQNIDEDPVHGYEVRWIDTALSNPVENVIEVFPGPGSPFEFSPSPFLVGDRLFFDGIDELGFEGRWIDTTLDTPVVNDFDIYEGYVWFDNFDFETLISGDFYFTAADQQHGTELRGISYVDDNPELFTVDINPGPISSSSSFLHRVGNELFFAGRIAGHGLEVFSVMAETSVADQSIFYDGASISQSTDSPLDEDTMAPDKTPLLPGETASFANYISYDKGINGISLYFYNLAEDPTLENWTDFFEFRVGNDNTFASPGWTAAPDPIGIEIDRLDNVDRVNIRWEDNSIVNEWLEITSLANEFTGLTDPDVHYWGSAVGETGNSATDALVNVLDIGGVRNNLSGFSTVDINNNYDFNRDGRVNVLDIAIVRLNLSGFFGLNLISPPAGDASKDDGSKVVLNSKSLASNGFDERLSATIDSNQKYHVCFAPIAESKRLAHSEDLSGAIKLEDQTVDRDQFFAIEDLEEESDYDSSLKDQLRIDLSAAAKPLAIQAGMPTPR